jgi:hypothetical protein
MNLDGISVISELSSHPVTGKIQRIGGMPQLVLPAMQMAVSFSPRVQLTC